MKKYFLFACVAAALVSCSSDEFLGENQEFTQKEEGAILFKSAQPKAQRGTLVGESAATALNNVFYVYGTKHAAAEDKTATNDAVVFDNYQIKWTANTAGTAEDNTHNWAYVGLPAYDGTTQSIKYWDYSAAKGYTFTAFSYPGLTNGDDHSSDLVQVAKITAAGASGTVYDKGYTVTLKNGADVSNLYYSDRKEVAKSEYNNVVTLTFRQFGSKVRVGFYETIPGYSVKIDRFYFDTDAAAAVTTFKAMDTESTTNFKAALPVVKTSGADQTVTVSYNTDETVKVTNNSTTSAYTLELGTGITAATKLSTVSNTPTWDNSGNYTTVYPNEANATPMLVRVDYTLTSDDGKGETIKVKNARAIVPVQYVQWKSNTAYTYLFKISNNTNGTTGTMPADPDNPGPDPESLFPITFDAVVVEATNDTQETITTVATNSVTSYAEASNVTVDGEYKNGTDIYLVTESQSTHAVLAPTAIGTAAGNAQVYAIGGTDAATATEADVLATLTGTSTADITLTAVTPAAELVQEVPASDGTKYDFGTNGATKFTPGAAGKYVYVYTTTAYVAPTYAAVGTATYDPAETYYFKTSEGVYYTVSGLDATNWEVNRPNLFVKSVNGTDGDYSVKVVIVQ